MCNFHPYFLLLPAFFLAPPPRRDPALAAKPTVLVGQLMYLPIVVAIFVRKAGWRERQGFLHVQCVPYTVLKSFFVASYEVALSK